MGKGKRGSKGMKGFVCVMSEGWHLGGERKGIRKGRGWLKEKK